MFASTSTAKQDQEFSTKLQEDSRRVPDISFPKVDIRGRRIPSFNKLAVFPPCSTCSDFSTRMFPIIQKDRQTRYLLLTEDLKQVVSYQKLDHCYIAVVKLVELDRRIQGTEVYGR
jgi:hypothetical protein